MSFLEKAVLILFLGALSLGIWLYASIFSNEVEAMAGNAGRVKGVSSVPIVVYDNGKRITGVSEGTDEETILSDLGVVVYPEDKIYCFPDPELGLGTTFRIERATLVHIRDAERIKKVRTWQKTVSDLLQEQGIELSGKDKIEPSLDTYLNQNIEIKITRIGVKKEEKRESIPYSIVNRSDPNMYQGQSYVKQNGCDGEKLLVYKKTYVNGKLMSKVLIKEKIVKRPINKIVIYGIKPRVTVACRFTETVIAAAMRYGLNPNDLCRCMMLESQGNPYSVDGRGEHFGLFQYKRGTWNNFSQKAGFAGVNIFNPTAQIYTTAWAWSHGYRGRWPNS